MTAKVSCGLKGCRNTLFSRCWEVPGKKSFRKFSMKNACAGTNQLSQALLTVKSRCLDLQVEGSCMASSSSWVNLRFEPLLRIEEHQSSYQPRKQIRTQYDVHPIWEQPIRQSVKEYIAIVPLSSVDYINGLLQFVFFLPRVRGDGVREEQVLDT